jgi:hypothetical protein
MSSGGEQRGEGELCPRQALDVVSSLHEIVSECLPRSLLARPSLAAGRHGWPHPRFRAAIRHGARKGNHDSLATLPVR